MNTISQAQYFILKEEITEVLKQGYSSRGDRFTDEETDSITTSMLMDWTSHCKIVSDEANPMTLLTDEMNEVLESTIYTVLICGHDSDGEELGMGEMGEVREASNLIIDQWIEKAGIELVSSKTILYWVVSVDIFDEPIIELKSTQILNFERGNEIPNFRDVPKEALKEIGSLTQENAADMERRDIDPTSEEKCIKYAKEVLNFDIPEDYILSCQS